MKQVRDRTVKHSGKATFHMHNATFQVSTTLIKDEGTFLPMGFSLHQPFFILILLFSKIKKPATRYDQVKTRGKHTSPLSLTQKELPKIVTSPSVLPI